jgi:hypothetical protein
MSQGNWSYAHNSSPEVGGVDLVRVDAEHCGEVIQEPTLKSNQSSNEVYFR